MGCNSAFKGLIGSNGVSEVFRKKMNRVSQQAYVVVPVDVTIDYENTDFNIWTC
jgi:hypothetical protein